MHAVVGLGNPGEEYRGTRHNAGFLLVEELLRRNRGGSLRREGRSYAGRLRVDGVEVVVVEPATFMNRSGAALREIQERHDLAPSSVLVAHDDMDLELGRVRVKRSGGTAGHLGLDSIVDALGTDRFPRIRLGVGRPPGGMDPVEYVLTGFRRSEGKAVQEMLEWAAEAAECFVREGLEAAMNRYNRWPR